MKRILISNVPMIVSTSFSLVSRNNSPTKIKVSRVTSHFFLLSFFRQDCNAISRDRSKKKKKPKPERVLRDEEPRFHVYARLVPWAIFARPRKLLPHRFARISDTNYSKTNKTFLLFHILHIKGPKDDRK